MSPLLSQYGPHVYDRLQSGLPCVKRMVRLSTSLGTKEELPEAGLAGAARGASLFELQLRRRPATL